MQKFGWDVDVNTSKDVRRSNEIEAATRKAFSLRQPRLWMALVLLRRSDKLFRPLRCKEFSATILGITKCVPRSAGRNKKDLSLAFREALGLGRTLETGLYYSDLFVRHKFGGAGGTQKLLVNIRMIVS